MARGTAVKVDVDWGRVERRLVGNVDKAQAILDDQVLKDTTPYVPRDIGNLVDSGVRATRPGSGEVIWGGGEEDYAAAQYYGLPNKAHDVHPLATMRWFESAKAANKDAWLRVAKRAGGQGR